MDNNADQKRLLVSHLTLRRAVGSLGILLPFILAIGCFACGTCTELQTSISAYYGTEMRNVLVGVLFTIGWFLFAYRGHDRHDNYAGNLACLFALGVALFPTTSTEPGIHVLHLTFAALLFLVLAYFSMVLFRKTKDPNTMTPQKKARNRIYFWCGVIMLGCIALIATYSIFLQGSGLAAFKPVFWLEAAALMAFGVSWFVKGETLWTDAETA